VANTPKKRTNSKRKANDKVAADLVRGKLSDIYDEPNVKVEIFESEQTRNPSKHQKFMRELTGSGEDIATIQTAWHEYYQSLSEDEKLEVWDEFYNSNKNVQKANIIRPDQPREMVQSKNKVISKTKYKPRPRQPRADQPTTKRRSEAPKPKVKLQAKHHVQSLIFGLSMGFIVVLIFLFGFFNEVVIAPFIQPSRNVSVPIIIGSDNIAPTATPEVIIPKINVQIPVDYNINTTDENVIENGLEDGVVHFPTTVLPGQVGNAAFFGHSSNNIFNPGRYKFAFVLLHTLVNGDTFYLTYNHTLYVYKVISHTIVSPNDVSVLGPVSGQTATATLITCDPPGTSINRLVVVGQQISPTVSTDTQPATTALTSVQSTKVLPSNGQTLGGRFISSSVGKVIVVLIAVVAVIFIFKRTSKKEPF